MTSMADYCHAQGGSALPLTTSLAVPAMLGMSFEASSPEVIQNPSHGWVQSGKEGPSCG